MQTAPSIRPRPILPPPLPSRRPTPSVIPLNDEDLIEVDEDWLISDIDVESFSP